MLNHPIEKLIEYTRAKGDKPRSTLSPVFIHSKLTEQMEIVKPLNEEDLANGFGEVYLPQASA